MLGISLVSRRISRRIAFERFVACAASLLALFACAGPAVAAASDPAEIAGVWDVTKDQAPIRCRISLNPERSDKGDYFVGVPVACRRAMPVFVKIGRWSLPAPDHLAFLSPNGDTVIDATADGKNFTGHGPDGAVYHFVSVHPAGRDILGAEPVSAEQAEAAKPEIIELAARKKPPRAEPEALEARPGDLAGRYAVLREKNRDTGCMLTLDDKTRVRGGDRAALAPACRDQGIVIFDPTAWQIVKGRLVLTAKAGHVTHLDKQSDGTWLKDPAEGKSLALKKL